MKWGVFETGHGDVHVIPVKQGFFLSDGMVSGHALDEVCLCEPALNKDGVYVHTEH